MVDCSHYGDLMQPHVVRIHSRGRLSKRVHGIVCLDESMLAHGKRHRLDIVEDDEAVLVTFDLNFFRSAETASCTTRRKGGFQAKIPSSFFLQTCIELVLFLLVGSPCLRYGEKKSSHPGTKAKFQTPVLNGTD